GHACQLEIQIKSGETNWIQFTRNYSPNPDGWDTLHVTLNQFVQPPDVGLFDPSHVQAFAVNIRILHPAVVYQELFENIYFDAPDQPVATGTTYATYTSTNDSFLIQSIGLEASGNVILSWPGTAILESAPEPTGPWTNILGATSPFKVVPVGTQSFFR